jgi:multidrug efflux pump subunit AcrA (membrane-fusion protein)
VYSAQAAYSDLTEPPTENEVAALKASLLNAEAEVRRAQSEYDRAYSRNPAAIGAAPEALALEKATNAYNLAQANYDRAFEQAAPGALANASAQISSAKARLEALTPVTETVQQAAARRDQACAAWQQAELNVQKATLTAPFDGTLTRVAFEPGDWMAAGAPAVEIADLRGPWFEMQVDEADLGGVRVGDPARVSLQAYPTQPIPAAVESIASTGAGAGSVVTFRVRLALPGDAAAPAATLAAAPESGDEPIVLLGMSGTAEIVTGLARDTLVVPNAALAVDRETRSFSVRKLDAGGQPVEVPVKVGLRGADETQILEGLSAGDVVVAQAK